MEIKTEAKSLILLKVATMVLFASILLPTNLKSIAVILWAVAVVLTVFMSQLAFRKNYFLYSTLFFIVVIVSYLYSDNKVYALRKLSTMSSLLVFPLLFGLLNKEVRKAMRGWKLLLLKIYIYSVLVFNIVPFIYLWITHYTFSEMIIHYATIVRVDFGKFAIHPIYLSMHTSLAIIFSFFLIVKSTSKKIITVLLAIDLVLLTFLVLYAKKGPLIALCLMLFLTLFFQRKKKFFKPYLVSIIILIGVTVLVPKTRNKFIELFKIENVEVGNVNSTNLRYSIYETAIHLISDSPVIGYGIGDYNDLLIEAYKEDGNDVLYEGKYNAHNQYLSLLLIGGVIAVFLFVVFLAFNTIIAIRFDNQLLILTMIFYSIVMLTENILERESGVLYFSLFVGYFSIFNFKEA